MAQDVLRKAGNLVNQYFGAVNTATSKGALGDLLSYIQNELTKYPGTSEADPNAPSFDVVNNVITNLLGATGLSDPVSQIGGPSQAILGPIGRVTAEAAGSAGAAKGVNQAQKKIIKAIFRGDPETLKEVVQSPRMMQVGVPGAGATGLSKQNQQELVDAVMQASYAHFQPGGLGGTVRVHPKVMRGISPRLNTPLKAQGVEGLPDMAVHEATHFLNEPGFDILRKGGGLAQFDLGAALRPFLGHTAYGPRIVEQNLMRGNTPTAVNEALSYLAQPTGRAPAATWLNNALTDRPRAGGIAQFDDMTQQLLQEVLGNLQNVPGVRRFR